MIMFNVLYLQINMDDYCGDESEEKNPYPANDYIGNPCFCWGNLFIHYNMSLFLLEPVVVKFSAL